MQRELGSSGLKVGAVGMGCMYLSIRDRPGEDDAVRTLLAAIDAGVTLLDTADVYCIDHRDIGHNERLIARALRDERPPRIVVATKGGLERPKGAWTRNARPDHLRRACEASLAALGVDRIDVYQLHAPDPGVPLAESVGELARLRAEGKIAHVGLSNVTVREIDQRAGPRSRSSACRIDGTRVTAPPRRTASSRTARSSASRFYRTRRSVARAAPGRSRQTGRLAAEATGRGVSPHRLVLAWMLAKSPAVIAIPGARRIESIEDCAQAATLELTPSAVAAIEEAF